MGKLSIDNCKWSESCRCNHTKAIHCSQCTWYYMIDSGYGYCRVFPEPVVVGWCRDVCSQYKERVVSDE